MKPAFSIAASIDALRVDELHDLVVAAFRDLSITPPSSVLKESATDFLVRLKTETVLIAEAEGVLVGSLFCTAKEDTLYIARLAVRDDFRRRGSQVR